MHETLKIPTSMCLNSVSGEKTKYSDHKFLFVSTCKTDLI